MNGVVRVPRLFVALVILLPVGAFAQVAVTLPDTSQTTTLTASVSDQATVTVPATVTFNVTNVGTATPASAASVSASSIVLAAGTNQLKISLQANAAGFTSPGASPTWTAANVTWNAATWTNAAGSAGTLSAAAFNTVATCTAGTASCSTTGLVFSLASNTSVTRSGNHTLVVTWKFESI